MTAARLQSAGITTVRDLLWRLPRGYEDLRRVTPLPELGQCPDGAVVVIRGEVRRVHVFPRRLLDVVVEEGGVTVRARWFRPAPGMSRSFGRGMAVALAGPLRTAKDGARELVHPSVVTAALAAAGEAGLGIRPRYAPVEGVSARILERIYAVALEAVEALELDLDLLPAAARGRLGLGRLRESLLRVHAPTEGAGDLAGARKRIALEEMLVAQVAFLLRRAAAGSPSLVVRQEVTAGVAARVELALGIVLSPSQRRALMDVAGDLAAARAIQRLVIGDVGSGKTAVAFGAAAMIAAAGGSTLMMVPTEALAGQHAETLVRPAGQVGLAVAALTGATAPSARAAVLREAAAGRPTLVIGTQALLEVDGEFSGLAGTPPGLVIVDEQHRFGVAQRARLGRGGLGPAPHLLALSATPIPRSLALTLNGDLDCSFLLERPSGRPPPPAILCLDPDDRQGPYTRVRAEVAGGRQAFVVCPVRETTKRPGAATAIGQAGRLAIALAPARVGLVHGDLPPAEKTAVLRAFAEGVLDVLVATTVIELGIDVPNATVMVIEDADRFGIAQLHQLRGRVGRGDAAGVCFLCGDGGAMGDDARARLEAVSREVDGFRLAELDLAQRGSGDLFGTRQAGIGIAATLELGELGELAAIARAEAARLLADDPELSRPENRRLGQLARARAETMFAGDAG